VRARLVIDGAGFGEFRGGELLAEVALDGGADFDAAFFVARGEDDGVWAHLGPDHRHGLLFGSAHEHLHLHGGAPCL
jgi:hypothetical protein